MSTYKEDSSEIDDFFQRLSVESQKKVYDRSKKPSGCLLSIKVLFIVTGIVFFILGIFIFPLFILSFISFAISLVFHITQKSVKGNAPTNILLNTEFKKNILPRLTRSVYPNVTYEEKGNISPQYLKTADFFKTSFFDQEDWLSSEDYFSGELDNVTFEFCEITHFIKSMEKKKFFAMLSLLILDIFINDGDESFAEDLNKDSFTKVNKNFRGFFLYADFHKGFDGEIIIESKKRGALEKILKKESLSTIISENEVVNKKYIIKASNKQLGYYVISPKMIEAIERITHDFGSSLRMKIKDGKLFLIVPLRHNYFESYRLAKNKAKANTKEDILRELQTIKYLVQTLNLDTRIWSKL